MLVLAGGTTLGVVVLSFRRWFRPGGQGPGCARRSASRRARSRGSPPRRGRQLALLAQQAAVLVTLWLANNRGSQGAVNVYAHLQAVYLLR